MSQKKISEDRYLKQPDSTWKWIVIILLTFLSAYFIISNSNNRHSYKREIKRLESEKDSLNMKLSISIPKDSITYYITQQEYYSQVIDMLNENIAAIKKKYDERKTINVDTLSIDDNIRILTKFLSKQAGDKQ